MKWVNLLLRIFFVNTNEGTSSNYLKVLQELWLSKQV